MELNPATLTPSQEAAVECITKFNQRSKEKINREKLVFAVMENNGKCPVAPPPFLPTRDMALRTVPALMTANPPGLTKFLNVRIFCISSRNLAGKNRQGTVFDSSSPFVVIITDPKCYVEILRSVE
jgi:hypothetical protein